MSAVFVCQEYECECPLRPADRCVNCPKNRPSPEQAKDDLSDPYAATRRAITRVAAEIGWNMP